MSSIGGASHKPLLPSRQEAEMNQRPISGQRQSFSDFDDPMRHLRGTEPSNQSTAELLREVESQVSQASRRTVLGNESRLNELREELREQKVKMEDWMKGVSESGLLSDSRIAEIEQKMKEVRRDVEGQEQRMEQIQQEAMQPLEQEALELIRQEME